MSEPLEIEEERLMEIVAAALEPVKRAVEKLDEARLAAEARADRLERERDGAIRGREANAAAYMEAEGRAVEAEQELRIEEDAVGHLESTIRGIKAKFPVVLPDAPEKAVSAAQQQFNEIEELVRIALSGRAAVSGSGKEKPR